MTFDQIAILALLAVMLIVFASNRIRFELIALCGLAVGGLLGLVRPATLFDGFASPTVITVLEILLIVEVLKRSRLVDLAGDVLGNWAKGDRSIIVGLCAMGAFLSIFMNNIGALALMMPLALSVCERNDITVRQVMMPLAFATLIGGLCSVVGTPANLIGSAAMFDVRGSQLGFFELSYVGLPLVVAGLIYLYFVTPDRPLLPRSRRSRQARHGRPYACELEVLAGSELVGAEPGSLGEQRGLVIHNILRSGKYAFGAEKRAIRAGDVLVAEIGEDTLDDLIAREQVRYFIDPRADLHSARIEAVVLPESIFVGSHIADLETFVAIGGHVESVGITPRRIEGRLTDLRLATGDIVVFRGNPEAVTAEARESGLLPLDPSEILKPPRADFTPPVLFALGVAASAFLAVPPAIAFGLVVIALAITGALSLRHGFESLNWPILIMLGAMIPLGNAVAETGAATVLAQWTVSILPGATALTLTAAMLLLAVLLTPFINNPSTVLVLAPIGIEIARQYGLPAEPVVIAIVVGASLDFLTPFGHHNNTLVMGVAGYSFGDFLRLGAPLVAICYLVTIVAVTIFF